MKVAFFIGHLLACTCLTDSYATSQSDKTIILWYKTHTQRVTYYFTWFGRKRDNSIRAFSFRCTAHYHEATNNLLVGKMRCKIMTNDYSITFMKSWVRCSSVRLGPQHIICHSLLSNAPPSFFHVKCPGPRFNIKMSSYQYRKSHCGDKTVVRSSYLHNGISCTGNVIFILNRGPDRNKKL